MHITDIEGRILAITNLDEALIQAELFKEFRHENAEFAEFDEYLQKYWTDIYEKLLQLKNETGSAIQ